MAPSQVREDSLPEEQEGHLLSSKTFWWEGISVCRVAWHTLLALILYSRVKGG